MSGSRTVRLNKVLRELNISLDRAVEYLAKNGHQIEARPTTKISSEIYQVLQDGFETDANKKAASKEVGEEKRKEKEAIRLELEAKIEKKRLEDEKKEDEKKEGKKKQKLTQDILSAFRTNWDSQSKEAAMASAQPASKVVPAPKAITVVMIIAASQLLPRRTSNMGLPLEHGSDQRETLATRVLEDLQLSIFRCQFFFLEKFRLRKSGFGGVKQFLT